MKLFIRKKLNQAGMLSLHVVLPVLVAIVVIGGVGAYVLTKSQAAIPIDERIASFSCQISASPLPKKGTTTKYTITVKNIGNKSAQVKAGWSTQSVKQGVGLADLDLGYISQGSSKTVSKSVATPTKDFYGGIPVSIALNMYTPNNQGNLAYYSSTCSKLWRF